MMFVSEIAERGLSSRDVELRSYKFGLLCVWV